MRAKALGPSIWFQILLGKVCQVGMFSVSFLSKRCLSSSCLSVDRIRFKYRFKTSEVELNFESFLGNVCKMNLKESFIMDRG